MRSSGSQLINLRKSRSRVLYLESLSRSSAEIEFSQVSKQALQTDNRFDAYKLVSERWLAFERDCALQGRIPRIRFDSANGFVVDTPQGNCFICRSLETGRIQDATPPRFRPEPGTYPFRFDQDGKLKNSLLDECTRRNIQVIFTSIPYKGYDEAWGRRVAGELGYPHVTVDPEGIELIDPTHMAASGRRLFSSRLGARLKETGCFDAALRTANRSTGQLK